MKSTELRQSNGLRCTILDYGAIIQHLILPGGNDPADSGVDIVLGFDSNEDYAVKSHPYFGCVVGRFANRIKNAQFTVDSQTYNVSANRPPHCLHGGFKGWDKCYWNVEEVSETSVKLSYFSPDGDEGFPGNVRASVVYTLEPKGLRIDYEATTDKITPINMTNHSYFNLHGACRSVTDHNLTLNCKQYLVCDETVVPTGEIRDVAGSEYDFTQGGKIGKANGFFHGDNGYDNCFVINRKGGEITSDGLCFTAKASSELTEIKMEIWTTQPGAQFYSANFFDDSIKAKSSHLAKSTKDTYGKQFAFALETQHFPDSPNHPEFPNVFIRPGEVYRHSTLLKFDW